MGKSITMEQYYSLVQMIQLLKNAGIKTTRPNICIKVREGIIKPQAFVQKGKRRYPKYSKEYINRLIACATSNVLLDWSKVKKISELEIAQKI